MRRPWMKSTRFLPLFALLLSNAALAQSFPTRYWGAPYSLNSYNTKYATVSGPIHAFMDGLTPIPENDCFFRSVEVDPAEYSGEILAIIRDGEISSAGDCWRSGAIVASMYYFDPYKNLGSPCHCTSTFGSPLFGDPINAATGNKFEEDTDFVDPASWLTFKRYYNSDQAIASTAMGRHWRHSFDLSIDFAGLPPAIAPVTKLMLLRRDGRRETFNKINGQWSTDPDITDRLVENVDPQGATLSYSFYNAAEQRYETYNPDGLLTSVTDQRNHSLTFTYSTASTPPSLAPRSGLLLSAVDSHGRQLQFIYNNEGLLAQVVQPDGGTLAYAYDSNGNLLSVTYPDASARQYKYNEASMTGGNNLPSALTGVIDEVGKRLDTTTYDIFGWATSSTMPGGADSVEITYQHAWGPATAAAIQFPLGQTVDVGFAMIHGQYKVEAANKPCGVRCGQTWQSAIFDGNGYPTSITDFNDQVYQTTYDSNGLMIQRIEASGLPAQRTTNLDWNVPLRVPLSRTVLDGDGRVTAQSSWNYNAVGQPTAQCEADPGVAGAVDYACGSSTNAPAGVRQQRTTYCEAVDTTQCPLIGLPLVIDGARTDVSDITTFTYYLADSATAKHGDLKTVSDALGHTTTFLSYDGAGRVLSQQDANGVITTYTYYPRGWLHTKTVGNATTSITYTPYGAIASITDPDSVATTYGYDDAHRLTHITDAQGNVIDYTLDAAGNKVAEQIQTASGAVVHSLSRTYNSLGQLTRIVDGLNHTVFDATASESYDGNGNLVHSADALGIQHRRDFDALNRLISTIDDYNGTNAGTRNTTSALAYDAMDRLEGVADPDNLNTIYGYDGLGNRTSVESPDTGAASDTYDAAGNRLTHTDAKGVISTSTYDALNRLVGGDYADSTLNVEYRYDESNTVTGCAGSYPLGRLTRVVEHAVSTIYCYDARGNVTRKSQIQGTTTDTTSYAYTAADRLSAQANSTGNAIQYSHDANGRISAISLQTASGSALAISAVGYMPFGPVSSYTLGNHQTITRTYDTNYALVDLASPTLNLHFARDATGNITALGDVPGANPAIETYTYDALYRLTTVTGGGSVLESYTYNKTGDRLSKTASGLATGTYSYTSGTHRLAGVGNALRNSDANGNTIDSVVGGETFGYGYDDRNRLTLAQRNGQTVGSYTYNALGQRVAKVAALPLATNERYVYDEASHLVGEYGTTSRDYVWLGDLPVAIIDNTINGSVTTSVVNYIIADQLGTPRAVTDSAGTMIWSWPYQGNPSGERLPTSSNGYVLNLRYPGQYYDAETNTNYNYFRNYEPAVGRYLQSDPSGLAGGISTYAYVKNNPLTAIDPTGLVGYIWQSGNNISIVLPIAFTGGTFDQQQAMAAAITSTWTGQFGQYNVVTTVINGSSLNIPVNAITIAPGSGDAHGLSRVFGDAKSGRWFAQPSRSQCLDYAHEAGHLMGLGERPDSQTIMDNVYTTPTVTPEEIQAILNSPFNVVRHSQ